MRIAPSAGPKRAALALCALLLTLALNACGSSAATTAAGGPRAAQLCVDATVGALQGVARRIYGEVAEGRILAEALDRAVASRALAQAVAAGEGAVAARVLRSLAAGQIVRAAVSRDGRTLAVIGLPGAIAPAHAHLLGPAGEVVGEVELSIDTAPEYAKTVLGVTGMQLVIRGQHQLLANTLGAGALGIPTAGTLTARGTQFQIASFTASTFSGHPATISVLIPADRLAGCHRRGAVPGTAQAVADALGAVGMNIYNGELHAEKVRAVVRQVEGAPAFRTAVEQRDPVVAREAIIALFQSRLHVVRMRVETPHGVLVDLGGPYVLAPVRGAIRDAGGRVIGHFLIALQDDMGYMLLAHAFTGAQVVMRVGRTQVMGTLSPGPASVPEHGSVQYGGATYQTFSFLARAFPEGALRISLLFAQPAG